MTQRPRPSVPEAPCAASRRGPRPLGLHLGAAALATTQACLAAPAVRAGAFPWLPALAAKGASLAHNKGASLAHNVEDPSAPAFAQALDAECRRRAATFLDGLEAYRAHPYARTATEPPAIWAAGTTRLLDYGTCPGATGGTPVLLVPSLVNRSYVLDLAEGASLARHLAENGFRPLLVDWDAPGEAERRFTLTDYVMKRLVPALDAANDLAGGPVPVLGYCMGGLLAVALACRRPAQVGALVALATPWDFHADAGGPPPVLAAIAPGLAALGETLGVLPVDLIQSLFFSLDPMQGWAKFRRFATMDPNSVSAQRFVALEEWANDGVPLAGAVARDCLLGWYVGNTPATGQWHIDDAPVRPQDLDHPALVVVPARDRIVPPRSAVALADALRHADRLTPPAGHVGMVVGSRAHEGLWTPLVDWLSRHATS